MLTRFLIFALLTSGLFALHAGEKADKNNFGAQKTNKFIQYKNSLAEKGILFEAAYTGEVFSNLSGGIRQKTTFLDDRDLTLTLDFDKLTGWKNTTFFIYFIGNFGGDPTEFVGDAQGASNIEAYNTWKLYEAWVEKVFAGAFSVRAGLYDINTEFDVKEFAGLFLNSSHGIGPDFSQAGLNGPSIFPTTSPGMRLRVDFPRRLYFQAAVLDGVPGDLNNADGTHIKFGKTDGLLLVNEAGFQGDVEADGYQKYGLGFWKFTTAFTSIMDGSRKNGTFGVYAFGEKKLSPKTGVFLRVGVADSRVNQFGFFTGSGVVFSGLLQPGSQDQLGLSIAYAQNGHHVIDAFRQNNLALENSETTFEATYSFFLTHWFLFQPDLQYIVNPGTNPGINNAFISNFRFELSL